MGSWAWSGRRWRWCLLLAAAAAWSCSSSGPPADPPASPGFLVAVSDYSSSELGLVTLDAGASWLAGGATLGPDPQLASSAGRLFWIERHGGDVLEIDPGTGGILNGPWTTVDPSVPGSTDPQDVAVDGYGRVWVARYLVSSLLVKSSDGATVEGTVDLSTVAGVNRNPYMSSIRIVGDKAYVTLEMLYPYPRSVDPSYIVRLNVLPPPEVGSIDAALRLKGRNPLNLLVEQDPYLYLAEAGDVNLTNETDAGVERVDLRTFTSELLVRESDIGASVDQVSVTDGCGTAIVMGPGPLNVTSVISFDPVAGGILTPLDAGLLATPAGFKLAGMAWLPGGVNVIGDRTGVDGRGFALHALLASTGCALRQQPETLLAPQGPVAIVPAPAQVAPGASATAVSRRVGDVGRDARR